MNTTLTPEQRKKVSAAMSILGTISGKKNTPAQRRARQKNMRKALKFRHRKPLAAA